MRRVFSFLLVTCLLLSLCACHVEPPVDSTTTAPADTNTTAPNGTTAPIPVDIIPKTDGWVNIDGSKWSFFANGGYYHDPQMGQQFLAFTDVSNGITVVLCAKPGCKHHEAPARERDECDAYLGDNTYGIFFFLRRHLQTISFLRYGGILVKRRNRRQVRAAAAENTASQLHFLRRGNDGGERSR